MKESSIKKNPVNLTADREKLHKMKNFYFSPINSKMSENVNTLPAEEVERAEKLAQDALFWYNLTELIFAARQRQDPAN